MPKTLNTFFPIKMILVLVVTGEVGSWGEKAIAYKTMKQTRELGAMYCLERGGVDPAYAASGHTHSVMVGFFLPSHLSA